LLAPSLPTQVDFQGIKNMLSFHGVVGAVREPPMRDSVQTICIFVCRTRSAFHLKRPDTPGNHIVQSPGFFTPYDFLISRLYPAPEKSTTEGRIRKGELLSITTKFPIKFSLSITPKYSCYVIGNLMLIK